MSWGACGLNLLLVRLYNFSVFSELWHLFLYSAGNGGAQASEEYYGMANADANAQGFAGQDGQA